jgi:CheY-like chemotaxis protein
MGGSISVKSEVGKGSTFTVALPLKKAAGTPPDAMSIVDEQTTPAPAQRRARVLIAEDHDVNQMLMLSMATSANFDAEIAENGAEAIAMVEAAVRAGAPFDLVLMDMQMPVVDGLAATRELRAKGFSSTQLPIVALTANAYQDDIAACRAAGMQAHLSKPVRAREIREVVAKFTQATVPASVPTPAGLAAKPSARTLYMERRTQTLNAVAEAVRRGQVDAVSLAAIVDLLHKLAGTAGFFGEDGLGAAASELEDRLSCATEADAICILSAGIVSLSKAA